MKTSIKVIFSVIALLAWLSMVTVPTTKTAYASARDPHHHEGTTTICYNTDEQVCDKHLAL